MDARLDLAQRLAFELKAHGLERHVQHLRDYYAAIRAGRRAAWSDSHVRLLAQVFQVLGVEALEVRAQGAGCCPGFLARTVMVISDRHLVCCSGCGRRWLTFWEAGRTAA